MRYAFKVMLVSLLLTPVAFAASKRSFEGTIVKLDKNRINFDAVDSRGKSYRGYAYTDETVKITIDGKDATMGDLRLGMHVVVKMRNKQVAAEITADTGAKK